MFFVFGMLSNSYLQSFRLGAFQLATFALVHDVQARQRKGQRQKIILWKGACSVINLCVYCFSPSRLSVSHVPYIIIASKECPHVGPRNGSILRYGTHSGMQNWSWHEH